MKLTRIIRTEKAEQTRTTSLAKTTRDIRSLLGRVFDTDFDPETDIKRLGRIIGTIIFEVPTKQSGLVSSALLDNWGFRPSLKFCTEEHFYSRQWAGENLIHLCMERGVVLRTSDIRDLLELYTTIHLVTSEENQKLLYIQNSADHKDKTWEEQYEIAEIDLVEDRGTRPAYFLDVWQVGDNSFMDLDQAVEHLKLPWDEIKKRCQSNAKKWESWKHIPQDSALLDLNK